MHSNAKCTAFFHSGVFDLSNALAKAFLDLLIQESSEIG